MAVVRLTVEPNEDATRYESTLLLDGQQFDFAAYTAKAIDPHWCFDFYDAAGNLVVEGDTLAVGVPLLRRYQYRDVPRGILFVQRTDGVGTDPIPGDFLDGTAALYYVTPDDPLIGEA